MKKILTSIFILSISMFGATNELLIPKDNSTIVDIGYNQPKSTYEVTVPKDWVDYTALIKTVDNAIYSKERELSPKYDCETDYLGRENCTVQSVDCTAQLEQDNGISKLINKTQIVNKIKVSVPRNQALNPNVLKGDYRLAPNIGAVDGSMFSIQYDASFSNSLPAVSTMMADGFLKDGKFTIKAFNFGSGYGQLYFNQRPSRTTTLISGGSGVSNGAISSPDGHYALVEMQWDTPPSVLTFGCDDFCLVGRPNDPQFGFWNWSCPETFVDADGILSESGTCKKQYSFYEYKCKDENNIYDRPWIGPVKDSGGDCNGNCGPSGCICNSSTPPANNCVRDNFTCPFDSTQLCTITTDDKASVNNVIDGYIYSNGSATTYNNSITIDKTCQNGVSWNSSKDICQDDITYVCLNSKFIYDKDLGECVQPKECDGKLLEDGTCVEDSIATCQEGYTFNKAFGRCESNPICDRGTYNTFSDMCEDDIKCPSGFVFNSTNERCEAPYEQKSMTCPNSTDVYMDGFPSYCITKPILTQPIYIGNWSYMWWNCDKCGIMPISHLQTLMKKAGGTGTILSGSAVKNDSSNTVQIGINGSYINIKPGEYASVQYKRILNVTTGVSKSAGGKPMIYLKASITCNNWKTMPGTKDFPPHQVCADISRDYASCPSGYIMGNQNGNPICYKEPECQTGYKLSPNKMQCIHTVVCEAGYTADYANNKCIKNGINGILLDLVSGVYFIKTTCPGGEIMDVKSKMCAFESTCNYTGKLDPNSDRCILNADFSCPDVKTAECEEGYYYDSKKATCMSIPSCGTGTWDYINNVCVSEASCPTGYIYDEKKGICEKVIETQPYNCLPNETLYDTKEKDVCRIKKIDGVCNNGYTESLNATYCEREIACPSDYPNIDYVNNVCYKL